jgi:hypothetical protein
MPSQDSQILMKRKGSYYIIFSDQLVQMLEQKSNLKDLLWHKQIKVGWAGRTCNHPNNMKV